jgi:predicted Zn-dependent protease
MGWQPWRRTVSFHVRQCALLEKSQPEPATPRLRRAKELSDPFRFGEALALAAEYLERADAKPAAVQQQLKSNPRNKEFYARLARATPHQGTAAQTSQAVARPGHLPQGPVVK